jgi:hypothetical protein
VLCAITSGLACVHFGVAETTKDCDLLCHPASFPVLLEELARTPVTGLPCRYRGNLSPPLDERWHRGGWTSHFNWGRGPDAVTFDVFGRALRGSSAWEPQLIGLYTHPHVVAEMKRTNRRKDWAFITLLGVKLVRSGDARCWRHVFRPDTLRELAATHQCPPAEAARRPALAFLLNGDPRYAGALSAEEKLWEKLDALRIEIYQRALRPYNAAVRKSAIPDNTPLLKEHAIRLRCAEETQTETPLKDHGVPRLLDAARRALVEEGLIPAEGLEWLPDVTDNFCYLEA